MGEIWTVKGRERERVTAAERAVVTPQRRKLLGKSMHGPPTTRVAFPDLVGLMPIGRILAASLVVLNEELCHRSCVRRVRFDPQHLQLPTAAIFSLQL